MLQHQISRCVVSNWVSLCMCFSLSLSGIIWLRECPTHQVLCVRLNEWLRRQMDFHLSFWEKKGNGLELAIFRLRPFMTTVLLQTHLRKQKDQSCQLEIRQKGHFLPDILARTQHVVAYWNCSPQRCERMKWSSHVNPPDTGNRHGVKAPSGLLKDCHCWRL